MELKDIKGLGEARIKKLKEAGIETPLDLCCHFPARYIDLNKVNNFIKLESGDEVVGLGKAVNIERKVIRKNLRFVRVEFAINGGGSFFATWFNQPYIIRAISMDTQYFVLGKYKKIAGRDEISAPVLKKADTTENIIPVYKSAGLPANILREAIKATLSEIKINGLLDKKTRDKYNLTDTYLAFKSAHFPKSIAEANAARHSLSLENLAGFIALYKGAKSRGTKHKAHVYKNTENLLINKLPFKLTEGQKKAYENIVKSLMDKQPANILIEGDVGCGKTVVCLLAISLAAQNGYQSVLMAPTELLARQHFKTVNSLFSINEVEFLSGSQTPSQRAASAFNISCGNAKIIIGTHSVFNKDIVYQNLTLVITDEQQRFGVYQRGALENKSIMPDRIVMSATPMPRTLALTLYGDLELIQITEKPQKKASVHTRFVGEKLPQMYDYIQKKAKEGEQTFIVCSRIDGDEELEIVGAADLYKSLKPRFRDNIGLLHGRMKDIDKTSIMSRFASGEIKILVSTTIIEVGIDIPAATTMVVYNAERYGLTQLHQLRGRIGRGSKDGYCFLLATEEAYKSRLKFLESCSDGFLLAEKDFYLRGAGDFLGTRQHGNSLTFTGQPITVEILTLAKEIAEQIDPNGLSIMGDTDLYFKEIALN